MRYSKNSPVQISAHFNSREFMCQCGKNHEIELNTKLVGNLEKLYTMLKCSKIIITSGVRCAQHSVAVGGYATDEHVKGNAADIMCYGQDGKIINSKMVCCAAQLIGFAGIGRISTTATHVDVSTTRTWKGDEMGGTANTVTSDFFTYFNIAKNSLGGNVENTVEILINGKSVYKGAFS